MVGATLKWLFKLENTALSSVGDKLQIESLRRVCNYYGNSLACMLFCNHPVGHHSSTSSSCKYSCRSPLLLLLLFLWYGHFYLNLLRSTLCYFFSIIFFTCSSCLKVVKYNLCHLLVLSMRSSMDSTAPKPLCGIFIMLNYEAHNKESLQRAY